MPSVYDDIAYWERKMAYLEHRITSYARVRAWTTEIILEIELLECNIEECEDELNKLYSEVDKIEWIYD